MSDGSTGGASETDPVAVVTGAARGIGRALALRLAGDGWRLVLVDLDEAGLEEVTSELTASEGPAPSPRVASFVADVADEAEVGRLHERVGATFGGVRALVNNAGIGGTGTPIEEIDHQRDLIPWHRIGRPDDVAAAVAYLVSPAAEFMTGQVLHLNGGAAM